VYLILINWYEVRQTFQLSLKMLPHLVQFFFGLGDKDPQLNLVSIQLKYLLSTISEAAYIYICIYFFKNFLFQTAIPLFAILPIRAFFLSSKSSSCLVFLVYLDP
jgi:hypothetical protein